MAKKITAIGLMICLSLSVLMTNNVFGANSCGGVDTLILSCGEEEGIEHIFDLIVDIMSIGVGILGVIGISIVGIQYLKAGGNEQKATIAKRRMLEIVIGLACYVVLYAGINWLLGNKNNSEKSSTASTSQAKKNDGDDNDGAAKKDTSTPGNNKPSNSNDKASGNEKSSANSKNSNTSKSTSEQKKTEKKEEEKKNEKKIIITLGASQVRRIAGSNFLNLNEYNSGEADQDFKVADGTLNFVYKSGTGFEYQSGDGWNKAESIINSHAKDKDDTVFHVFFTLSGNDIKRYDCSEIKASNSELLKQIKKYNQLISQKKKAGYKIKGYVTSMHPVESSNPEKSKRVVDDNSEDRCKAGFRSNRKYRLYNHVMKSFVDEQSDLTYIETFDSIVDSKYQFVDEWKDYKTTDGFHWDTHTAEKYFKFWMGKTGEL